MSDILTTNENDPDLGWGVNKVITPQNKKYLVLSKEDRERGFLRPLRNVYIHDKCNVKTSMNNAIAETYATNPHFYGATYCCHCEQHLPVGEFKWEDGTVVGS